MKTELVPITDVRPLDRNPRRHPERQLAELVKSIEQFGQYRPLVVDEDGMILAGNGLHVALGRAGVEQVSVYRMTGLSESQKTKLVLADNRTGDLSNDDFDVVEAMLSELSDFEVPGYDPDMLRSLVADAEDITAEADEYGTIDPEIRDRMISREETLDEYNEQATVGRAPDPLEDGAVTVDDGGTVELDFSTGTPAGDALADAVETRKSSGHVCPACGRGW